MTKFEDLLEDQLKDEQFKAEYEALDPEFQLMQIMIDVRKESGMTQQQLAQACGISQADISRLERGNANPSLKTMQRIAAALGKTVQIKFV